ncbi:MAG: hypothetical protein OXL96_27315 [Candidatus Poribacteria bacterium]|nr:hypothetical protein [Candidatus Poribacteria bacterium]
MLTKEHFYHIGAKEENRKPMLEALVMNYTRHRYPHAKAWGLCFLATAVFA